jgi:hypothetical protein
MFVKSPTGQIYEHIDALGTCIDALERSFDLRGVFQIHSIKFRLVLFLPHAQDKFLSGLLVLIDDTDTESALRQPCHYSLADAARAPCNYSNFICHCFALPLTKITDPFSGASGGNLTAEALRTPRKKF